MLEVRDSSALYCHANVCMCVFVFVGLSGGLLVNRFVNLWVSGFVFCVSGVCGLVGLRALFSSWMRVCVCVVVSLCVSVCLFVCNRVLVRLLM